jgi:beta-phosphoglucomutase-like phosphatase (HAD superfamily)
MRLKLFAALLLDMDGTLVDSETLWRVAERDFASRHGFSLDPAMQATFVGKEVKQVMAFLKEHYGLKGEVKALAEELESIVKTLLPEVAAFSGTQELFDILETQQLPRAIVSNSTHVIIAATLAKQSWAQQVPQRFSVEDVAHGKPAPDSYLLAANTLGVPPQSCLVLEDSVPGMTAALRARMTCCLITHGLISSEEVQALTGYAPHVFESLQGVLEWLQTSDR